MQMSETPELEISSLSGPLSSGGHVLDIQIYRLVGEADWVLEIEDPYGNTTVWDDRFETERAAMVEAKRSILEETSAAFMGPADGKASGNWK